MRHAFEPGRVDFLACPALVQDHVFPGQELLEILHGHAHDRQEDRRREHPRDPRHEIAPTFGCDLLDEFRGQLLLRVTQALDAAWREVLRQHLTPLGMVRRVDHDWDPLVRRLRIRRHDDAAGPELRVLQSVQDHRVVGEDPVIHVGLGVTENRPGLVLTLVEQVEVRQRRRVRSVHVDVLHGTCCCGLILDHDVLPCGSERARTPSTRGSHTTTVHCQSVANCGDDSQQTHPTRLTMLRDERNSPRTPTGTVNGRRSRRRVARRHR